MNEFITIELKDNFSLHSNLFLQIPSIKLSVKADTYYFALDDSVKEHEDVLITILDQWKKKIQQVKIGEVCFLPFDFSDQYIGCFKFEKITGEAIKGYYGYTQKYMVITFILQRFNNLILLMMILKQRRNPLKSR